MTMGRFDHCLAAGQTGQTGAARGLGLTADEEVVGAGEAGRRLLERGDVTLGIPWSKVCV